jgi:hypothetical protein
LPALSAGRLPALSAGRLPALSAGRLSALSAERLASLAADGMSALSPHELATLSPHELTTLSAERLATQAAHPLSAVTSAAGRGGRISAPRRRIGLVTARRDGERAHEHGHSRRAPSVHSEILRWSDQLHQRAPFRAGSR